MSTVTRLYDDEWSASLYGDFERNEFTAESPEMVFVARMV